MNTQIAKFKINDTVKITGRGLVFVGEIIQSSINHGDYIEFEFSGERIKRKIKGVDLARRIDNTINHVGLLIGCRNKKEIDDIRNSPPNDTLAIIYK